MADDFSALQSEVATLKTNVTSVEAEVALLKAGNPSNQPAIDAITADVKAANVALSGLLPTPPVPLTVTPASFNVAVGAGVSETVTIAGGVAPYTVTATDGLSASLSGVDLSISGSIAAPGEGTVAVTDSSSPVQTAVVTVTAA